MVNELLQDSHTDKLVPSALRGTNIQRTRLKPVRKVECTSVCKQYVEIYKDL